MRKDIGEAWLAGKWPIFLTGPAGTGKTCAAACLFRWFPGPVDAKRQCLWLSVGSEVKSVCSANGAGLAVVQSQTSDATAMRSAFWMLSRLRDAAFVVLDDLGTRPPTDPQYEALNDIVNARAGKPTVYTSNLGIADIGRLYDDRTASRLGRGAVIPCCGQDRRMG
jgi:DNA replication protein DnaC